MSPPVANFLTTNSGWISRKLNDTATTALTGYTAYVVAHGVPDNVWQAAIPLILALISWLAGILLSRAAHDANQAMIPPDLHLGDALPKAAK
jgi:hypothetical protein